MKRFLTLALLIILCSTGNLRAQEFCAPRVAKYVEEDAKAGIKTGGILFVGSSTFDGWTTLKKDFPEFDITNRGVGGSSMRDILYYYDKLVKPHKPYQIIVYEGDNELNHAGYTVDEFIADMMCFVRLSQINFPSVDICIVSIKPSPARKVSYAKYLHANAILRDMCANNPKLHYIDIWPLMVDIKNEVIDKEMYRSDSLHMTPKGYIIWQKAIEPYLKKNN